MSLLPIVHGGASVSGGFDAEATTNSIWFDGSSDRMDSASMSAQSDATCYIWSAWVMLNKFGTEQYFWSMEGGNYSSFKIESTGVLCFYTEGISSIKPAKKMKDTGWYHILLSAKGGSGAKIFINGVEQSTTQVGSGIPTNIISASNTHTHRLAGYFVGATGGSLIPYQGYMSQVVFLDGFSIQDGDVAISDFLDTAADRFVARSDANMKTVVDSGGSNSYLLNFSNASDIGNDFSSKGNDFSLTSMGSANHSKNSPSNTYPVMNALDPSNSTRTFSEGNLRVSASGGADGAAISTLPLPTSGTTEVQFKLHNGAGGVGIIAKEEAQKVSIAANNASGGVSTNFNASYTYWENGQLRTVLSSGISSSSVFNSFSTNDVITLRYDADNNELNFLKNNSAEGSTINTVASVLYYPFVVRFNNYDITTVFDKDDFTHTIGSGNQELNTSTLSTTSFSNPQAFTFKGNAATDGNIIYFGFTPSASDAMTINSNSVTYGTDVDRQGNGVKIISSSSNFNSTGTNTISVVTANALEINGSKPPGHGQAN